MKRAARLLPGLAASFFLGACASAPQSTDDGRGWFADADPAEAKLAYGAPQSDDVDLILSCAPRSGRVALMRSGPADPGGVTLASGSRRVTVPGRSAPDLITGGLLTTGETPADTAVLRRFRDTGRLAVIRDGEPHALPATAAERAAIRTFLDSCVG